MYRDTPNFEFVTVEQDWAADANDTSVLVPGTPRVIVGRDSMWLDYRAEKVAETLRAIASALDPITEDVTT
jgi:hypothetical protein